MALQIKQIKELPDYFITNTGQVFSTRISTRYNKFGNLREIKPKVTKKGYYYVGGYAENAVGIERKWLRIHRVVYQEFIGNIPNGMEIDHINCDKSDNRLENLQMLTKRDNLKKWHDVDKPKRNAKKNKAR